MSRVVNLLAFVAALALVGCSSSRQQIVGTWKGDIVPPTATEDASKPGSDIGKDLAAGIKGFVNALVGPLTLEFNADGKYKASLSVGSATGTYIVSGNEVSLTPDDPGNKKANIDLKHLEISSDGRTLETKKEFNSDSVIILKKQ